ncbi:Mob1/phocein [Auricularia subglabra TFB-10046 SS5]|nr:Mob1/phocein [Auricularia subglabra TFB-10046 SS5]
MAAAVATRPAHGARLADFFPAVPEPLPNVGEIESAFQLQEYISLLIRHDVHDVSHIVAVPASVPDDKSIDEGCWVYEQLRRLAQDLTHPLITTLQQECTRQSCPEMKAGEWLYLCVAHGNGGTTECCAIDYILHTLDSATALLNSPRAFPSRISIPPASHRHFSSLARRLSRIFAHAYFHHREAFEQSEAETSLYARFLALSQKFDLVPPEFLVIPSPAAQPPALPAVPNLSTATTGGPSGSSPNSESPNDALSPGSLARLGRPRTDTMYFSGDFNFMQAAAAAGSPLQTAAPEPKPALHDLREPDQTNASLDIFHHPFENAPRAETVPLPSEGEAEDDASNPFADPPAAESPIEHASNEVVERDFGAAAAKDEQEEEVGVEEPDLARGKSPLVEPKLDEAKEEQAEEKTEEKEEKEEEEEEEEEQEEEEEEQEEEEEGGKAQAGAEAEAEVEAAPTEDAAKETEATTEDAPKEPEAPVAAT